MQDKQAELTHLEQLLRTGQAAGFIDAVATAKAKQADLILTTMAAFAGEPELLYAAIRYAGLHGLDVRIANSPEAAAA